VEVLGFPDDKPTQVCHFRELGTGKFLFRVSGKGQKPLVLINSTLFSDIKKALLPGLFLW